MVNSNNMNQGEIDPLTTAHVMTVRGPVSPNSIGPTMTHEHIFLNFDQFYDPSGLHDPTLGEQPMSSYVGGLCRWDSCSIRDNLGQQPHKDWDMVAEELGQYLDAGGSCIVELTVEGLNPFPADVRRISEASGIHIVQGVGFYVHAFHPEWIESASVEELEQHLLSEVSEGVNKSGVIPGIMGEIGTSATLQDCEERVLRACARVARRTGLPINVHCEPPTLDVVMQILDVLAEEGHDLTRTSLSHLDEIIDIEYLETVLRRGVIVGFDSFGQDGYFSPTLKSRSDQEKMETLVALIERGYEDQLVLSMDMGKKHYLKRFGGMGYDHVLRRIIPRLRTIYGVTDVVMDKLLVTTPRRLLTIDPITLS
jgi:phosphotriesterase-related protein